MNNKPDFVPKFLLEYKDLKNKYSGEESTADLSISELEILFKSFLWEILSEFKPTAEETKLFYTRKEACELLNVSNATLHRLMLSGELKSHKLGGSTIFLKEELINTIKNN
jgi:excisionase family DNA binding protein